MGNIVSDCGYDTRRRRGGVGYDPRVYSGALAVGPRGGVWGVGPGGQRYSRSPASIARMMGYGSGAGYAARYGGGAGYAAGYGGARHRYRYRR
jgi:hypothetical protein